MLKYIVSLLQLVRKIWYFKGIAKGLQLLCFEIRIRFVIDVTIDVNKLVLKKETYNWLIVSFDECDFRIKRGIFTAKLCTTFYIKPLCTFRSKIFYQNFCLLFSLCRLCSCTLYRKNGNCLYLHISRLIFPPPFLSVLLVPETLPTRLGCVEYVDTDRSRKTRFLSFPTFPSLPVQLPFREVSLPTSRPVSYLGLTHDEGVVPSRVCDCRCFRE